MQGNKEYAYSPDLPGPDLPGRVEKATKEGEGVLCFAVYAKNRTAIVFVTTRGS